MTIYPIVLTVKTNGIRATIAATSDQVLSDVLEANGVPYEGIDYKVGLRTLKGGDFDLTLGELGFTADTLMVSVKRQDNA